MNFSFGVFFRLFLGHFCFIRQSQWRETGKTGKRKGTTCSKVAVACRAVNLHGYMVSALHGEPQGHPLNFSEVFIDIDLFHIWVKYMMNTFFSCGELFL